MKNKSFSWGKVIETFNYNFDGKEVEIIKYHPWKTNGCEVLRGKVNYNEIEYECEAIHETATTLEYLIIAWIAKNKLGSSQSGLVSGIARALNISM